MSRYYFIIMVREHYQAVIGQQSLRWRGYTPPLSSEEVITVEICGEQFGLSQDEERHHYFRSHYQHFFPELEERMGFVRQASNL